jgi:hypothetical protein
MSNKIFFFMTATLAYKKAPFFVVVRYAEGSANFMDKRSSDFKKTAISIEKKEELCYNK